KIKEYDDAKWINILGSFNQTLFQKENKNYFLKDLITLQKEKKISYLQNNLRHLVEIDHLNELFIKFERFLKENPELKKQKILAPDVLQKMIKIYSNVAKSFDERKGQIKKEATFTQKDFFEDAISFFDLISMSFKDNENQS